MHNNKQTKMKQKEVKPLREQMATEQANLDAITHQELTSPVLDHDHTTGHVRAVLNRGVNGSMGWGGIESRVEWLAKQAGCSWEEMMYRLIAYKTKDYSKTPIHPTHGVKKKRKRKVKKAK